MKNKIGALLCALPVLLIACEKIAELLTFTVSDTTTITIPASGVNLPLDILSPEIESSADQEFKNNNTAANLVKDVKLTELQMNIQSPAGETFAFLESINVYISSNSTDEILLASLNEIPNTATSINLTPTTEKLDRYIKAEKYKLRTEMVTRGSVDQETEVEIKLKFRVTADPL